MLRSYLELLRTSPHLIAFGVLLTFAGSFGQTFFIALFGAELRGVFELSHGGFGSIYSAATLASALFLPWAGRLIDVVPVGRFATCVILGLAVACLLMASASHVVLLGLALFGLRLTGQGLMAHTAMTTMARSFEAERGRAIGLALMGISAGEIVFPLLALLGLAAGWRMAWAAYALLLVSIVLPLMRRLLTGAATRHRYSPIADTRTPASSPGLDARADASRLALLASSPAGDLIRDHRHGIFFHQTHIAASKGWPLPWLASCFTAYALSAVAASLVAGSLIDRLSARRILPFIPAIMALGLLVLALGEGNWVTLVMMACLGLSNGAQATAFVALWAELYGTAHLGAIRALTTAMGVLGSAVSPALFGWLFDFGASVMTVALGSALYVLSGASLTAMGLRLPQPTRSAGLSQH